MKRPHCATCTCASWFEILSHHLVAVLERALGLALGVIVVWWIAQHFALWPDWLGPLQQLLDSVIVKVRQSY